MSYNIKENSYIIFKNLTNDSDVRKHVGVYKDGIVYGVHYKYSGVPFNEIVLNNCLIEIKEPGSQVYCG